MRQLNHQNEREKIASTAARLIAMRGINNVKVSDIAEELGATRGKVHYYFDSKQAVVDAAFSWNNKRADERLAVIAGGALDENQALEIIDNLLPLNEETDIEWKVRYACWSYALESSAGVNFQNKEFDDRLEQIISITRAMQESGLISTQQSAESIATHIHDLTIGLSMILLYVPMEKRKQRAQVLYDYLAGIIVGTTT